VGNLSITLVREGGQVEDRSTKREREKGREERKIGQTLNWERSSKKTSGRFKKLKGLMRIAGIPKCITEKTFPTRPIS
jgi:hypothetical protein